VGVDPNAHGDQVSKPYTYETCCVAARGEDINEMRDHPKKEAFPGEVRELLMKARKTISDPERRL